MPQFELPTTPAQLAFAAAQQVHPTNFSITPEDSTVIDNLERSADILGFLEQKYFTDAHRAFLLPDDLLDPESSVPNVSYVDFQDGLTFEGRFTSFSQVRIGRLVGGQTIRALCLAFYSATLLPYFDTTPDDHLLHIPVLAVKEMSASPDTI